MSHDRARLETALNQLQIELHALEGVDPQVRQRLERTIEDIQRELREPVADAALTEPTAETEKHPGSFADRLTDAARHFEETHPNLAGMVGSVIDALARMGI